MAQVGASLRGIESDMKTMKDSMKTINERLDYVDIRSENDSAREHNRLICFESRNPASKVLKPLKKKIAGIGDHLPGIFKCDPVPADLKVGDFPLKYVPMDLDSLENMTFYQVDYLAMAYSTTFGINERDSHFGRIRKLMMFLSYR